jgi:Holliday junction DNA helicase RuvA
MSLIAAVEGTLKAKGIDYVLVQVGGVTFHVAVPTPDLAGLDPIGGPVRLATHLVVREDDLQLYGFATEPGRRIFQLLLEVSGVGPRVALALLSALPPEAAAAAIASGDAQALSGAQGVGKRTAERIILDLKGKLEEEFGLLAVAMTSADDGHQDAALRALVALGYKPLEARQALSVERDQELPLEERVRRALQRMGQG